MLSGTLHKDTVLGGLGSNLASVSWHTCAYQSQGNQTDGVIVPKWLKTILVPSLLAQGPRLNDTVDELNESSGLYVVRATE